MPSRLADELADHQTLAARVARELRPEIERAAELVRAAFARGGRLYAFGNGGSAADAQHLAAEMAGRFRADRRPFPAIALAANAPILTCIGNDYDFAEVFARQIEALAVPGDLAVGLSTSGESENVVRGLRAAKSLGVQTIALTGGAGGRAAASADVALLVPSHVTARIQEMHILIIHLICAVIDEWAAELSPAGPA